MARLLQGSRQGVIKTENKARFLEKKAIEWGEKKETPKLHHHFLLYIY